jgi:hypothetical protein
VSARRRAIALVLALSIAACHTETSTPRGRSGPTRTLLTDSPFPYDRVARVDLYVVSVSASLKPDTGTTSGFVTLASPGRSINVLALQHGLTDELGNVTLPSGAISAVRMVIDTDRSSITLKNGTVLTGSSTPGIHWQSSAGQPTLNALVHEQIQVPDTGAVIVIDYDVGKAFIQPQDVDPTSTDNGFIFSPVLRAVDSARTGAIAGVERANTAKGTAVLDASLQLSLGNPTQPEGTWSVLATAATNSEGVFRFTYMPPSSYWAALPAQAGKVYIVTADAPSGTGLSRAIVPNVTVNAGSTTAIGTIVLP